MGAPHLVVSRYHTSHGRLDESREVWLATNVADDHRDGAHVALGLLEPVLVLALHQSHVDEERVDDEHGRVRVLFERLLHEHVQTREDLVSGAVDLGRVDERGLWNEA